MAKKLVTALLTAKKKLPAPITGLILALSLLPFLFYLPAFRTKTAWLYTAAFHGVISKYIIHIILEWSSVSIAIFTAIFAFIHYSIKRDISTPIIGMALVFGAFLNLFYVLSTVLFSLPFDSFIPYTWAVTKSFFFLVLIIGILLIYIRLHLSKINLFKNLVSYDVSFLLMASSILAFLAYIVVYNCRVNPAYPPIFMDSGFFTKPIDLIPLGFILLAAPIFYYHFKRYPSLFSHALLVSLIPAGAAQLSSAIASTHTFDLYMNTASMLTLLSFMVFFIGLALDYWQTYTDERRGKLKLQKSFVRLEKQKHELEKVNLELDSFVYTASHDLKTPLRGIASFASFLKEDYSENLDKDGVKYIERISKAAERMHDLINDLLTLSRISRIRNPYKTMDSLATVEKVIEQYQDLPRTKIKFVIREPLPLVYCDKVKMTEVFANLINNAVKFSLKQKKREPRITIGCEEKENEFLFYVKDNGIGIATEYHKQIFGLFTKLHSKTEGTGLGLNIVQRIVGEHKGIIWVESKEGKGATFYFTISKSLESKP